jgi:hypothetical protein
MRIAGNCPEFLLATAGKLRFNAEVGDDYVKRQP